MMTNLKWQQKIVPASGYVTIKYTEMEAHSVEVRSRAWGLQGGDTGTGQQGEMRGGRRRETRSRAASSPEDDKKKHRGEDWSFVFIFTHAQTFLQIQKNYKNEL